MACWAINVETSNMRNIRNNARKSKNMNLKHNG